MAWYKIHGAVRASVQECISVWKLSLFFAEPAGGSVMLSSLVRAAGIAPVWTVYIPALYRVSEWVSEAGPATDKALVLPVVSQCTVVKAAHRLFSDHRSRWIKTTKIILWFTVQNYNYKITNQVQFVPTQPGKHEKPGNLESGLLNEPLRHSLKL